MVYATDSVGNINIGYKTRTNNSGKINNNGHLSAATSAYSSFTGVYNNNKSTVKPGHFKSNFMPVSNLSFGWSLKEHFSQGANVIDSKTGEVQFKIWAPFAKDIKLQVIGQGSDKDTLYNARKPLDEKLITLFNSEADKNKALGVNEVKEIPMNRENDNFFYLTAKNVKPGDLYRYALTDYYGNTKYLKDLYSRSQPYDASGWSAVYDQNSYQWNDQKWMSGQDNRKVRYVPSVNNLNSITELQPPSDMVIDEVHIKALTEEGNFEAAKKQIDKIAKDGIFNSIQIMPVNEFPWDVSWGYNGVDMYAAESSYGGPEKLKELIDYAHGKGLNAIIDVVYNHWGTNDCVAHEYGPYFHPNMDTGWGKPFNFHNAFDDSQKIRRFAVDNALYWLKEFHADGLRLDQTHQLFSHDTIKKIAREVRQHVPDAVLIAEDEGCVRKLTLPLEHHDIDCKDVDHKCEVNQHNLNRLGFDAQWNFSLQHTLEDLLVNGYYPIDDFERELTQGAKSYKDPVYESAKPYNFINYFMSHDESGNWGGKRLIHKVMLNTVLRDTLREQAQKEVTEEAARNRVYLGDSYWQRVEERITKWIAGGNCDKVLFGVIKAYKSTNTEEEWNQALEAVKTQYNVNDSFHLTREQFKAKLKDAISIHRLAMGILFMTPGHKMMLMGDEEAELASFELDVRNSVIGKPGYQDPLAKKFTKEVSDIWKQHPALKNGNAYNLATYKKDNAVAVHRFDDSRNDNVFAVVNFDRNDKEEFYIPFPEGKWRQVVNSNDKKFGGHCEADMLNSGVINGEGLTHDKPEQKIKLPKQSITIFERID